MVLLCGTIHKYEQKPVNTTWNVITVILNYDALFKVYYTEYNNKKLIKPYCVYHQLEFEHLFNFGSHCKNYNPERIIDITEAIKL